MELIQGHFEYVDEVCEALQTWDVELNPLTDRAAGERAGVIVQAGDMDRQYMYAEFSAGLKMAGGPPDGLITFNLQEASDRHYWWRGHDLTAAMAWVFPLGGELRSISPQGFRVHTVSVQEDYVALLAAEMGFDLPPTLRRPETFPVPEAVLQAIRVRLNSVRMGRSSLARHTDDILRALLPLWLGEGARVAVPRESAHARERAIRRGLEFIESAEVGGLTAKALMDVCHVSERTLQYAFRERFGLTPAALIKSLRLAEARSSLLRADPEVAQIREIAADSGFWHLGQFAQDYRRRFGEKPSETLNRRRSTVAVG